MQADPLVLVVPKETFRAHSVVIRDLFMALVLSRYFQFPLVWVVFFFFFISHVTLSFPTSTPELFSMLLSSNEPSATTVSNSSFKMLPSNFIYHLFFIFRTHCYLKLIKKKKKSIIKKILRKNPHLYRPVNVTVTSFALEISPPDGALFSLSPLQSALRGQDPSLLCP